MALSAPSNICIQSEVNKKYLRFVEDRNANTYGLMQFRAGEMRDPYVQIEVVKSEKGDDVFHLKCRYNNKFLVRWLPDRYWISASADRPIEDETSWNCTLFRPILVQDGDIKQMRLQHVQIGYNLIIWTAPGFDSFLFVGSDDAPEPSKRDLFKVQVWDSFFKLPKRVTFRADTNLYLGVDLIGADKRPYMRFIYKDPKDPKAEHEVFQSNDGIICFKNTSTGKFWTVSNDPGYNRIVAEADEDPRVDNNVNGMFRLNPISTNVVALLNMSNKKYSQRHNSAVGNEYFCAITPSDLNVYGNLRITDLDKLA